MAKEIQKLTDALDLGPYRTTMGEKLSGMPPDHPREPLDDGPWEMIGSSTAMVTRPETKDRFVTSTVLIFWFWRRVAGVHPCKRCGAIARRDGRCLNCGLVTKG